MLLVWLCLCLWILLLPMGGHARQQAVVGGGVGWGLESLCVDCALLLYFVDFDVVGVCMRFVCLFRLCVFCCALGCFLCLFVFVLTFWMCCLRLYVFL
jgi:hypothetical protein